MNVKIMDSDEPAIIDNLSYAPPYVSFSDALRGVDFLHPSVRLYEVPYKAVVLTSYLARTSL